MLNSFFILLIVQFIGVIVPMIAFIILLNREQNRASVYLIISDIACFVVNASYYLILRNRDAREMGLLVQFHATTCMLFTFFFVLFVITYLRIKHPKWTFYVAALYVAFYFFTVWSNGFRGRLHTNIGVEQFADKDLAQVEMSQGLFNVIGNCVVCFALFLALFVTAYRCIKCSVRSERNALIRLGIADLLVLASTTAFIVSDIMYNIMPVASSAAILLITLSVVRGEFFSTRDMGQQWAIENLDEIFMIVDPCMHLIYSNESARKHLPEVGENNYGHKVTRAVGELFLEKETTCTIDDVVYEKNVEGIYKMNSKGKKELMGLTLIMRDITERIALMDNLAYERDRAEHAVKARSDFMSNMSHEIRTPMNAIVGMTDIMLRGDVSEENRSYLMNIKNSGKSLLTLVNDILDFSKIDAGKMELVNEDYDPMSMFNDIRMIILNRIGDKPIELIFEIDEKLPAKLYGDNLRLRQVIINIANNATKFTDEGSITIHMDVLENDGDNCHLYFAIRDTGQGIKEEDLGKLFGAFAQVDTVKNHSKEGTGLGLSISKQLVELMGGQIGVHSTYGEGSKFYFDIVQGVRSSEFAGNIDDAYKKAEKSRDEGDFAGFVAPDANVLIVDDNEMNLKVAKGLLAPLGMQIDTAENGKAAIAAVKAKEYDLVFMDHMMPIMDGVEATKNIRALDGQYFKSVPIIALSANVVKEAREEFASCGMNDFVSKPIEYKEICEKIRQYLPKDKVQSVSEAAGVGTGASAGVGEVAVAGAKAGVDVVVDLKAMDERFEKIEKAGFDLKAGIECSGNVEMYASLLKDFYNLAPVKANKINKLLDDNLIRDYTVEVHALKTNCRMLGLSDLSDEFKELEALGNAADVDTILQKTPGALDRLLAMREVLADFGSSNEGKREVSADEIRSICERLKTAVDDFDMDGVDSAFADLDGCVLPENILKFAENLRAYVADFSMQEILDTVEQILSNLGE